MNPIFQIYNLILYQPLLNALFFLYQYLNDFGLAIILLTILIRLIFYPLTLQSLRAQKNLSRLQPKIEEIEKKYKEDKEKKVRELISLYQKEKINPFSSLFLVFIQIPILIALYQVFLKGIKEIVSEPKFLGIINLSQPAPALAFFTGILQFFQSKTITPPQKFKQGQKGTAQFSKIFQNQMLYFFPIFTFLILLKLPAAIGLYWIVTILFSIFQQYLVSKSYAQTK